MDKIRFIHCADLHLDSPYSGLHHLPESILQDIKESTFLAFERIIEFAIDENVDFVLFVGDLFDQQSSSLKSLMRLKHGLNLLNEHNINAYISFGNHDFGMHDKLNFNMPPNTYLFTSEKVSHFVFEKKPLTKVYIYSFSYEERSVTHKKVNEYKRMSDDGLHIGMLHGSIQSNNEHDQYAPFLIEDLKKANFDYWALGHIHQRDILMKDPYAVYPGNIQGRHMKETGEKGCYLVELDEHETSLTFHPVQNIIFNEIELDLGNIQHSQQIIEQIELFKSKLRQQRMKMVVRLTLTIENETNILNDRKIIEMIDFLNESEEDEHTWIWIESIQVNKNINYDRNRLKSSHQFVGEVLRTIDNQDNITAYFTELLSNRKFNKYIDTLTNEELEEIKIRAEEMLLNELLKGGPAE